MGDADAKVEAIAFLARAIHRLKPQCRSAALRVDNLEIERARSMSSLVRPPEACVVNWTRTVAG